MIIEQNNKKILCLLIGFTSNYKAPLLRIDYVIKANFPKVNFGYGNHGNRHTINVVSLWNYKEEDLSLILNLSNTKIDETLIDQNGVIADTYYFCMNCGCYMDREKLECGCKSNRTSKTTLGFIKELMESKEYSIY